MAGLVPCEGGMGYSLTVYKNRACRFSKTVTHLLYMTPGYLCQNMQINRMRVQGYAGSCLVTRTQCPFNNISNVDKT